MAKNLWGVLDYVRLPATETRVILHPDKINPVVKKRALHFLDTLVIDAGWQSAAYHLVKVTLPETAPYAVVNGPYYGGLQLHEKYFDLVREHLKALRLIEDVAAELAGVKRAEDMMQRIKEDERMLGRRPRFDAGGRTYLYLRTMTNVSTMRNFMAQIVPHHQAEIAAAKALLEGTEPFEIHVHHQTPRKTKRRPKVKLTGEDLTKAVAIPSPVL